MSSIEKITFTLNFKKMHFTFFSFFNLSLFLLKFSNLVNQSLASMYYHLFNLYGIAWSVKLSSFCSQSNKRLTYIYVVRHQSRGLILFFLANQFNQIQNHILVHTPSTHVSHQTHEIIINYSTSQPFTQFSL